MCARFTVTAPPERLRQLFRLAGVTYHLPARYNVAPTQPVPAVINDGRRVLEPLQWGLVPAWSKDAKGGAKMINARVETVDTKPAFKEPFARRRCVVLADGFFEWTTQAGRRVPHYIRRRDGAPFAFAGLWDRWTKGPKELRTCTVLTLPPVGLFATLHDRMPAILPAENVDAWLSPDVGRAEALRALLVPPSSDAWTESVVSGLVNSSKHDSPECLAAPDVPDQGVMQLDLWK